MELEIKITKKLVDGGYNEQQARDVVKQMAEKDKKEGDD